MPITYTADMSGHDWSTIRAVILADNFDNGRTPEQYRLSFENSFAAVLAYDGPQLVGTARMLSDGVCNAYIVDVWTLTAYRRQGIAREMMRQLEARVPGQHISLWTDDMGAFYESCGYTPSNAGLYEKVVGAWLQNDTR
jgi:GNAT superfamily N-acetyltransferase